MISAITQAEGRAVAEFKVDERILVEEGARDQPGLADPPVLAEEHEGLGEKIERPDRRDDGVEDDHRARISGTVMCQNVCGPEAPSPAPPRRGRRECSAGRRA